MTLEQFEKAKEIHSEYARIMAFIDWLITLERRLTEVLGADEAKTLVNAIDSKLRAKIVALGEEMEAL